MSAGRGSRTPIPAAGWTSPTISTATRSPRRMTGPTTSRPRRSSSTTSVTARTASGCATASASAPRWWRPDSTRTGAGGRWRSSRRTGPTGSRPTPSSSPSDSSTDPICPRSTASGRSPGRRSTRHAGTTASTWPASGWPSSAPVRAPPSSFPASPKRRHTCWSSSGRRTGSCPRPTTRRRYPRGSCGCSVTSPRTTSGTGSGSSTGWPTGCCRPRRSTRTGRTTGRWVPSTTWPGSS